MNKFAARLALATALLIPAVSYATPIVGSDSIALINVTATPAGAPLNPISGISTIGYTLGLISGVGIGDFSVIAPGTPITASTLYPNGVNGGTAGSPFTFTIVGYGTFTETADPSVISNSTTPSSTAVTLYLLGTFVPTGALAGFDPNDAAFTIALTKTGGSYSGSGTFAVPPPTPPSVPEPSSLILLGTGLFGAVGAFRRRLA